MHADTQDAAGILALGQAYGVLHGHAHHSSSPALPLRYGSNAHIYLRRLVSQATLQAIDFSSGLPPLLNVALLPASAGEAAIAAGHIAPGPQGIIQPGHARMPACQMHGHACASPCEHVPIWSQYVRMLNDPQHACSAIRYTPTNETQSARRVPVMT